SRFCDRRRARSAWHGHAALGLKHRSVRRAPRNHGGGAKHGGAGGRERSLGGGGGGWVGVTACGPRFCLPGGGGRASASSAPARRRRSASGFCSASLSELSTGSESRSCACNLWS